MVLEGHKLSNKMDIDLFISPYGECGLLCNNAFGRAPAGLIFDAQTLELTIEFIEDSPFHLNITVEEILRDPILLTQKFYIGFLKNGLIEETIEVPLLYLNDPYGSDFNNLKKLKSPQSAMIAFEQFMKRSTSAQPIHREDLGNEESNSSVLKGMDPKHLEFVPQLIRQRLMDLGSSIPAAPAGYSAPAIGLAPKGPGGVSMGGSTRRQILPAKKPMTNQDEE